MKPTGFLGPVDSQWLKENKVVGCPHPQVPSGKICLFVYNLISIVNKELIVEFIKKKCILDSLDWPRNSQ